MSDKTQPATTIELSPEKTVDTEFASNNVESEGIPQDVNVSTEENDKKRPIDEDKKKKKKRRTNYDDDLPKEKSEDEQDKDDDEGDEDEDGEDDVGLDDEEDDLTEIDTTNIITTGRRTRGKVIDFAKAAEKLNKEGVKNDEEEDDNEFQAN